MRPSAICCCRYRLNLLEPPLPPSFPLPPVLSLGFDPFGTVCCHRYRLNLVEPPLGPLPSLPEGEKEWAELRPRWPLTGERHSRSMPAVRSMKQPDKMHTSLTELTQAALQQLEQEQQGMGEQVQQAGQSAVEAVTG